MILPTLLQYCSKLPLLIAPKLQILSDRTARHSTLSFDFQQIDLNYFNGVGISICCFCLNYQRFFLPISPSYPFSSQRYRQQRLFYGANEFQQTIDFLLTDFNDSNSIDTSTSCFCLNYIIFAIYVSFISIFKAPTTTNLIVIDYFSSS